MLAFALADAGFTALISFWFIGLGLLTQRRIRLGKFTPEKQGGARTGAWVAYAFAGLFLFLAARELLYG